MLNPITADPKLATLLRDYDAAPTLNEQASAQLLKQQRRVQVRAWVQRVASLRQASPVRWLAQRIGWFKN